MTPELAIATVAPETKLLPDRVTGTLAPWFPDIGSIPVRVGLAV